MNRGKRGLRKLGIGERRAHVLTTVERDRDARRPVLSVRKRRVNRDHATLSPKGASCCRKQSPGLVVVKMMKHTDRHDEIEMVGLHAYRGCVTSEELHVRTGAPAGVRDVLTVQV